MSFLSSPAPNRRLALLCVRLLVQSAMGWSIPQAGVDDLRSLLVWDFTNIAAFARRERELTTQGCTNGRPCSQASCPGQCSSPRHCT
jgi:hypothetical protein